MLVRFLFVFVIFRLFVSCAFRLCFSRSFVSVPFVRVRPVCLCSPRSFVRLDRVCLVYSIVFVSFIRSCSSHSFVRVPLIHSLVFVSFVRLTIVVSHARLPFSEDAFSSRKEEDEGEPMLFRVVFFFLFFTFPSVSHPAVLLLPKICERPLNDVEGHSNTDRHAATHERTRLGIK